MHAVWWCGVHVNTVVNGVCEVHDQLVISSQSHRHMHRVLVELQSAVKSIHCAIVTLPPPICTCLWCVVWRLVMLVHRTIHHTAA